MTARNHTIHIRFSKDEYEELRAKARKAHMPISVYLRFIGLGSEVSIHTEE